MNRDSNTVHFAPRVQKDISKEPEMKELKRMIRDGELDRTRTVEHLEETGSTLGPTIKGV